MWEFNSVLVEEWMICVDTSNIEGETPVVVPSKTCMERHNEELCFSFDTRKWIIKRMMSMVCSIIEKIARHKLKKNSMFLTSVYSKD